MPPLIYFLSFFALSYNVTFIFLRKKHTQKGEGVGIMWLMDDTGGLKKNATFFFLPFCLIWQTGFDET